MVNIRSDAGVEPRLTASVSLVVHNEVVPVLRRSIGSGLILPSAVRLTATADTDGHVPVCFNTTTGEIVSIDEPCVCATERGDLLRYVLTHELAHFHELSLRKARGIRVLGVGPTQLWSEYFAQRVSWESGLASTETLLAGGGEGVVANMAKRTEKQEAYSWAKMLTFILAHADAVPNWLDAYPGKENYLRATVGTLRESGAADGLFRRFPEWRKSDIDLAVKVFKGLLKFSRNHRPK